MNLLNKKILVFIGIFLSLVVFPIEKSFASTLLTTNIEVNGIKVDITRNLDADPEVYTVSTSDSLDNFSLVFDEDNQITLAKKELEGVASWDATLIYGGGTYSEKINNETRPRVIDDGIIAVKSLSENSISFSVSKDLADRIFDMMIDNCDSFTLTASSKGGKNIKVERGKIDGEDKYTFSSDEALESVEVRDGTDNIIINYENGSYEVSGQYKGISKSTTIAIGDVAAEAEINYSDDIKVGVLIQDGGKKITLGSDHETIERVAQMILDDKRNITEITISPDETYEIVSNSNLNNISASGDGGRVKFVVDSNSNSYSINKEITVNYSGDKVVFPAGTKITGPTGWTGEMSLPEIKASPTVTPSISGHSVSVSQTITIGGEGDFTFDKPVQLIFNGQKGKRVGFIKGGLFTEIEACGSANNIPSDKQDCKYDLESDLIVLTTHFTEFVVFTATPISSGGGGGSIYTFSNVNADVQSNQVVITFNVYPSSPAFLRYGTAQGGPYTEELTETESKSSHSFTLTGLSSGTTYYYKVGASNETSPEYYFTYIETETQSGGSTISTPIVVETESQTIKGDLTGDGVVDEYDFSLLMANWGKVGSNISDLNDDGVVDEYDFSLLMANWTI
jgi:hypothetical protein